MPVVELAIYTSVGAVGDVPVYGLANDNFFDNLSAGDYDIYVKDNNDCELGPVLYTVAVGDITPPTAICQDITVSLDADGEATITADQIDNGSTDNCAIVDLSVVPSSFTCANLGPNNVTLTVEDSNGNTATCNAIVTIVDDLPPTFTTPADITIYRDAACAYDADPSITGDVTDEADNCSVGEATYSDVVNAIDPCAVIITRTWTLVDDEGNVASQDQLITVVDNMSPVITLPPADLAMECFDATVVDAWTATASALDNCSGVTTVDATYTAPATNCSEVVTVTFTSTDDCGNVATETKDFTVDDVTGPVVTVPPTDLTMECFDAAAVDAWTATASALDNCSGVTNVDATYTAPATNCSEVVTVTFTSTDDCGNVTTETKDFTVDDVTGPVVTVPPTGLTMECFDTDLVDDWTATASALDNCSGVTNVDATYTAPATN